MFTSPIDWLFQRDDRNRLHYGFCTGALRLRLRSDESPLAERMQALVKAVLEGLFVRCIRLSTPVDVALLPNGHLVVCEYYKHRLQIVNPSSGTTIRMIGNGAGSAADQLCYPNGVAALTN